MKKIRKTLTFLRISVIVLVIILLLAIIYIVNNQPQEQGIPELAIYTVARNDVRNIVSVDGNIGGLNSRELVLPAGARVIKLNVRQNNTVDKNDEILVYETETVTGEKEESSIYAPISGLLIRNDAIGGNTYYSPTVFGEIVNTDDYKIIAQINENDIYLVEKNQTAEILIPAISLEDTFVGEVTFVDSSPSSIVGGVNYNVEVTLSNPPKETRLGMTAEIEILTDKEEDVISIPESFLIEENNDQYYVNVIEWLDEERTEYRVNKTEVTVGLITDEFAEVRRGIALGEELLEPSYIEERSSGLFDSF